MPRRDDQSGLTLLEVLVSLALLSIAAASAVQVLAWSVRALWASGAAVSSEALAQQKLEQLTALEWRFDAGGLRLSDPALQPSPADSADVNVPGYVEFLGADGSVAGAGVRAPPDAVFVRRWSVRPYAGDPADTLILHVRVTPLAFARRHGGRSPGEASQKTMRTRVQQ